MAKVTLSDISNLFGNPTSAANTINNNSQLIEQAFENTLSRDGTSPNQMNADLDLNHNDILNVDHLIIDGEDIKTKLDDEIQDRIDGDLALKSLISQAGSIEVPVFDTRLAVTFANIKPTVGVIRTGGFSSPGDGGACVYKRVEVEPTHPGKVQSDDGAWWEIANREIMSRMIGVKGDGTTNDDSSFTDFLFVCAYLNRLGVIERDASIALTGVDITLPGDLSIKSYGRVFSLLGSSSTTTNLINIDGDENLHSCVWHGGILDGNSSPRTILRIANCNLIDISPDESTGIIADTTSADVTAALLLQNAISMIVRPGYMHDLSKGTNTQGSVPRCMSINTCQSVVIYGGIFYNVHDVCTANDINADWFNCVVRNPNDQVLYFGSGEFRFHNPFMLNCEEPFVASDFGTGGGKITVFGGSIINSSNAIGFTSGLAIELYNVYIDQQSSTNGTVAKLRTSNVSAGHFIMQGCTVVVRPTGTLRPFDFTVGTLSYLVLRGNSFKIIYDNTRYTGSQFLVWSNSASYFIIEDNLFQLETPNSVGITDYFINLPAVTSLSSWKRNTFLNKTGVNTCNWRVNTFRQQLISHDETFVVPNVNSDGEINRGSLSDAPPSQGWSTSVPTSGYWQAGSVVRNRAPSAGGTEGWICVTSGSPGTWKTFGSISA